MKLNYNKKFTIKQMVLFISLFVVALEFIIFIFIFSKINIKQLLLTNDLSDFIDYNNIQKTRLENLFKNKFLINNKVDEVLKIIDEIILKNENYEINMEVTKSIINLVKTSQATGALLIFDKYPEEKGEKKSFYIRKNSSLALNEYDRVNMYAKIGDVSIVKDNNLSFDYDWQNKIYIGNKNYDEISKVYNEIYKNFINSTNKRDLHYWSYIKNDSLLDDKIITYAMPIIYNNQFYGMFLIEYDTGFLKNDLFINASNIGQIKDKSYALVEKTKNSTENSVIYNVISFNGINYNDIVKNNQIVLDQSNMNKIMENVYSVVFENLPFDEYIISAEPIQIYINKRDNANEFYSLYIMKKSMLFKNSNKILRLIWLPIIISFIFSVIAIFIVNRIIINQVIKLLDKVIKIGNSDYKETSNIYIKEIYDINKIMASLNKHIEDSSSRMQQIIETSGVSIGIIEYDQNTGIISSIGNVKDLLRFSNRLNNLRIIDPIVYRVELQSFFDKTTVYSREINKDNLFEKIIYKLKEDDNISYISINTKKINKKIYKVIQDETEKINNLIQIEYDKEHDYLTELYNRNAFREKVSKIIDKRDLKNAAMIMIDIDNLKYVNDNYSDEEGDYHIKYTGKILNENKELFDNVIMARMNGDEFFAFVYNFNSKEEILNKLSIIQEKLKIGYRSINNDKDFKIRTSISISWYPDDSNNMNELIKYADFAMYSIKNTDKGSINEFNIEKYNQDYILVQGKEAIEQLIEEKQVKFAFQPIVDVKTGEIFAYEALMRSTSSKISSVYDIMRLAKSQSKLHQIERLTWFGVLDAFKKQEKKFHNAKLFINTIPNINLSEKDYELIEEKYPDVLERLVIEIIESEEAEEKGVQIKRRYKEKWHCKLALDDFGAGYSTESALLLVNPDIIKIDIAIVRDIDTDKNRRKLVSNILEYTKNKNIKVLAEGVETVNELETLVKMGVHYIQGFYFAKPSFDVLEEIDREKILELKRLRLEEDIW